MIFSHYPADLNVLYCAYRDQTDHRFLDRDVKCVTEARLNVSDQPY